MDNDNGRTRHVKTAPRPGVGETTAHTAERPSGAKPLARSLALPSTATRPISRVIEALERHGCGPVQKGSGYTSRCPAHDDLHPSLSINEGDDGRALVFCHGPCETESVVDALGLTMADLAPPDLSSRIEAPAKRSAARSGFASLESAITWKLGKEIATLADKWRYTEAFWVTRFGYADGSKQFWPFRKDPDGWRIKAPEGKRPAYNLEAAIGADEFWWLEGEKCCVIAIGLGLVAVTSSNGSKSVRLTDWSWVKGKTLYIWPDNDEPGEKAAQELAAIAIKHGAIVKIVRPECTNEGDDIEQWLETRPDQWTKEQCKGELLRLAAEAPVWEPSLVKSPLCGAPGSAKKPAAEERPAIEINTERHLVVEETVKALVKDPDLLCRGDSLGIVIQEENEAAELPGGVKLDSARGSARFLRLSEPMVGCYLTKNATFFQWKTDKHGEPVYQDIHPPQWLIGSAATRGYWPGIRQLRSISLCPFVRDDGSFPEPGYDRATRAFYKPSIVIDPLPGRPTRRDASEAAGRLFYVVRQFPFEHGDDWAVCLAGILTAIQRPVIDGPAPGFAYTANRAGAGKGLLIDIAGILALGHKIPTHTYPIDRVEAGKVKLSLALSGVQAVHFDNLPEGGSYGNSELDSALTSTEVGGRILGMSKDSGSVPLCIWWALSGNNVYPGKDAGRRWLPCNLQTEFESPHERSDIEEKNLRKYVGDNRAELLRDALIVLKAHAIAGRPRQDGTAALGSFEEWDRIVRGAVWYATGSDCLETQRRANQDSPERQDKLALLEGWKALQDNSKDGQNGFTVEQALQLVTDDPEANPMLHAAFMRMSRDGKMPTSSKIGARIRSANRVRTGDYRFEKDSELNHSSVWKVIGK